MKSETIQFLWDGEALARLVADLPTFGLIALMAVCIAVLVKGAHWMIDGVVFLARRTGIPRIVIGATIVSLGTTLPEMIVSVMAAWMGNPGLALGNGVGSIICDTGMIFGLVCILSRIPVNRFILSRTGWVQVGTATLLVVISLIMLMAMEGEPVLSRWVGFAFLLLLVCYLFVSYFWAKQGTPPGEQEEDPGSPGVGKSLLLVVTGLTLVIAGSRVLIPCAAEIARRFGVPDDVIAATLVAFGTSLPELITAIAAVRRGHPEIMVGNVVGADVLNCLFVIGAAAAARPLAVPTNFFTLHFPAMLFILYSFRFFIFMNKDNWFKRWQGGWLFGIYLLYIFLQYALNINSIH